jgi:uncharacterized protein HemX
MEPAAVPSEPLADKPIEADPTVPAASTALKPKRSKMPLMMLVIVIVLIALVVAAYFAFLKKDDKPAASSTNNTQSTTATTTDPDAVDKSIDSAVSKLDDSKDYAASDLSDTTLGL